MNRPYADIFKGRRVFITGHTGFKGSWLALWLHELGAKVIGYGLPPEYTRSHFELLKIQDFVKHHETDILDAERLGNVVVESKPHFVFHMAAQSLVRRSYRSPKETFDTNVAGSVNLLEAVRACPEVEALVFVTSDKCYKNRKLDRGYHENDELGGLDPYSASKAAAELVFASYSHSYFDARPSFGAASVRGGNVIGGCDWAEDRLIPDCIRSLEDQSPIALRNPNSVRPWQHVLDALHGYIRLATRLQKQPKEFSGSWNFGPEEGTPMTVLEIAERIIEVWGGGSIKIDQDPQAVYENPALRLQIVKAKEGLDWDPYWDTDRSVVETVNWYKGLRDGLDPAMLSRAQITEFESQIAPEF